GGELLGEVLEQLGERRHGVAGEEAAAARDGGLGHGLGSLHQPLGHGTSTSVGWSYLKTSKQKSGQTSRHARQPVQPGTSCAERWRWLRRAGAGTTGGTPPWR